MKTLHNFAKSILNWFYKNYPAEDMMNIKTTVTLHPQKLDFTTYKFLS